MSDTLAGKCPICGLYSSVHMLRPPSGVTMTRRQQAEWAKEIADFDEEMISRFLIVEEVVMSAIADRFKRCEHKTYERRAFIEGQAQLFTGNTP